MKIKEVSEITGLSKKTIRFYEDTGLIRPEKHPVNGREFRSYDEEDLSLLHDISVLRKARFTIAEIKKLQNDAQPLSELFEAYYARIADEKNELDQLLAVLDTISKRGFRTKAELVHEISDVTEKMPLPYVDAHPNFRYIDAMEEKLNLKVKPKKEEDSKILNPLGGGIDANRAYRQFVASSSKNRDDNVAVWMGQFNEAVDDFKVRESGPVQEKEQSYPLPYRLIRGALTLSVELSLIAVVFLAKWRLWPVCAVSAALRAVLAYAEYRRRQKAWIDRMNGGK